MELMLNAAAVILAGGNSSRMGTDKALLKIGGQSLIERIATILDGLFRQLIIVTDRPILLDNIPVIITRDIITGKAKNSLRGIHAGLSASSYRDNFIVACDMPFINRGLIKYMSQFAPTFDVVIPRTGLHYQPLYAFYAKDIISLIAEQLAKNNYKIVNLFDMLRIKEISDEEVASFDPGAKCFFNINTHKDYLQAEEFLE